MNKTSHQRNLASVAIDDISKINKSRLVKLISHSEIPEKLIPYLLGDSYFLSKIAEIDGLRCYSIYTDLYDFLINDRVDYTYEVEEFKTVYINPQEFSSIVEINERFKSEAKPEHTLKPSGVFICPIVIPELVEKRDFCTYHEWENSAIKDSGSWRFQN